MAYTLDNAYESSNLTEFLDEAAMDTLGMDICEAVESDKESRKEWEENQRDWLKLAAQVRETKSFPWENASNVKYPLMTTACMQFHARALPGLLPNERPVKAKIIGKDKSNKKLRRGERVAKFMSYQVIEQMEEWVDDFDRLLLVLPMVGLAYKKTFYSERLNRLRSTLLLPTECIVNYHATSYERARMTHVMQMDPNELEEMKRGGIFRDVELAAPTEMKQDRTRDETLGLTRGNSKDDPYELYEVHHWWDLDEDGYKEPYIITVDVASQKVLRVVPRWSSTDDVKMTADGKRIASIKADTYFTPFKFIPDPNSAVYGIGLGTLLGPTNEAVNTLINQLIDAGTLSNMQGGFLARGAKLKGGSTRFRPGEWKIVNTTGEDLQKSIFPMPVAAPSPALFNLLSMLIQAGERVSAVSDMMTGENPGQNQPATTTMAVLEQGMKVFNSIYKRIHRSLAQEFRIMYRLNFDTLDDELYQTMLDDTIDMGQFQGQKPSPEQLQQVQQGVAAENAAATVQEDFESENMDIIPASDPNMVSDATRMLRANDLMEKMAAGLPINPAVVTRKVLEAAGHEDIDELMTMPPAQPSIEEKELEVAVNKEMREVVDSKFSNILKIAQAESMEAGTQLNEYRAIVDDIIKVNNAKREAQQPVDSAGGNPKAST
jgi:chaperonin GroES